MERTDYGRKFYGQKAETDGQAVLGEMLPIFYSLAILVYCFKTVMVLQVVVE